jgi:DNA repair exonuclease SbcCD ATPase subunit
MKTKKHMKKTAYTLLFSLLFIGIMNAQTVQEGEWMMSLGKQNAFFADMPEVTKDIAEDVWKEYMKDYGKVKRNKKAKEYYSQEANIPIIGGTQPLNVYAKFDERVDMTTVYLWIDQNAQFINSTTNADQAQTTKDFLANYIMMAQKKAFNKQLEDQEDELKDLNKDLEKLEDKNKDYHEDIEKAKEKIREAEENIEQNLKDQEDQRIRIEQQKKVIEAIIEKINNLGKG